ncbi:MAG TPA: DUF6132 family protein [bacterium]|nr:DUF6132 family protein [bacterium]
MRTLAAVALGALLGLAWWRFVGCSSGACPITSNPWASALYGAGLGFLMSRP